MTAEDANRINLTITGTGPGAYTFSGGIASNTENPAAESLFSEPNPHIQLIETICNDVLPNMVRVYDTNKMGYALDLDQFEKIIEQKVERAKKSLRMLPVEDQRMYQAKIDQAYAENLDRLHGIPGRKKPVFETKWRSHHSDNSFL